MSVAGIFSVEVFGLNELALSVFYMAVLWDEFFY